MPAVEIVFYQDEDRICPFIEWTNGLQDDAVDMMISAVEALQEWGFDLAFPTSRYLRDGIHELRIKFYRVNYRILYFFHERRAAVVSHGIVKQTGRVPEMEIQKAIRRKRLFEQDPDRHTYKEPDDDY